MNYTKRLTCKNGVLELLAAVMPGIVVCIFALKYAPLFCIAGVVGVFLNGFIKGASLNSASYDQPLLNTFDWGLRILLLTIAWAIVYMR